jgi:DNA-directed RNA polymerase subunit RPC12/RpoP
MALVPITVMGYRCERCGHEWLPRGTVKREPLQCPKCHSPYWNRPRKTAMLSYETFRDKVKAALHKSGPLTWTEIRTNAKLPEAFPNNRWVHRLEAEIGLKRNKDKHGIVKWSLG